MIPFLLGPIDISSSFFLVTISDNLPMVLTAVINEDNSIIYDLNPDLDLVLNPNRPDINLPIFRVSGTLNSLSFFDLINGGGIGYNDRLHLINVTTPVPLKVTQTEVANWNPPAIFLANIKYTFTTEDDKMVVPSSFYILPLTWYFQCSTGCCVVEPQTPSAPGTLLNWFCNFDSKAPWCNNMYPVTNEGWTNLGDCSLGQFYTYCPPSQYCGSNNCKGPCSNSSNICNWNFDSYQCQVNISSSNSSWWTTPAFIGSMIGLGVLIIVLLILIIILARNDNKLIIKDEA